MQILVPTRNARFSPAAAGLGPEVFVVVNQLIPEGGDETQCRRYAPEAAAPFAAFAERRERGVSRNRNRAIDLATDEICLMSDDDVAYVPDVCDRVEEAFAKFPAADILTFMQRTAPGGMLRKPYRRRSHPHSLLSAGKVGGPEIAFRLSRVREAGLRFDCDFGLGGAYPSDEEFVFLADALRRGLRLVFVPEVVSFHPLGDTGSRFATDPRLMRSKGAMMARTFGDLAPLAILAFAGKKMVAWRTASPTLLRRMFEGWSQYKRSAPSARRGCLPR